MSKTIIITTDEMSKIVKENFLYKPDTISDVYCKHCRSENERCLACVDDGPCPYTDDELVKFFVDIAFANYMIPFS